MYYDQGVQKKKKSSKHHKNKPEWQNDIDIVTPVRIDPFKDEALYTPKSKNRSRIKR